MKISCPCRESRPGRRKLIRLVSTGPGTGWTVRGSNPGGGDISRTLPDRSWGRPSLLDNGYRVFSPWVKRPGRGVDHPPPSSTKVKERVVIPLLSLWAFVACSRLNFHIVMIAIRYIARRRSTCTRRYDKMWCGLYHAFAATLLKYVTADIRRLTTGTRSEKCAVRRFRRSTNVIECTYTNLDSAAYFTSSHVCIFITFCWPCNLKYACNKTNLMHYLSSVYWVTAPLHVSGLRTPPSGGSNVRVYVTIGTFCTSSSTVGGHQVGFITRLCVCLRACNLLS
jgi:hypothetical protein